MAAELRTRVELSRTRRNGPDPANRAEGNTSIRTGPHRMLVKASDSQLGTAAGEDFVEVDIQARSTWSTTRQPARMTSRGLR